MVTYILDMYNKMKVFALSNQKKLVSKHLKKLPLVLKFLRIE